MHRVVLASACLLIVPALAAPAPPPGAVVHITLVDPLNLAPAAFPTLSAEVERLLASGGVRAVWSNAGSRPVLVDDDFLVILLPAAPSGNRDRTLGAVLGGVDRNGAAWIFWQPTAGLLHLDPNLRKKWSREQNHDLAQALGRVAAHELVHILLPMFPHASKGLMGRQLKDTDLLDSGIELDDTVLAGLRALGDVKTALKVRDVNRLPVPEDSELLLE